MMLEKIKLIFRRLWIWLKRFFGRFIKQAIPLVSQEIIEELKDFAINVIRELDVKRLSNEKKRQEAFERIKEEAKRRGMEVKDSLVNLLIELVLQYLKNR